MLACNCCSSSEGLWIFEFRKRAAIEAFVPGNQNESFSNDTYFHLGILHPAPSIVPFPSSFIFLFRTNLHASFFLQLALVGTWLWLSFHCLRQSSKRKQKFFDFKETLRKRAAELGERLTGADAAVWRIKIDWQFVSADCKQRDTEERPQRA